MRIADKTKEQLVEELESLRLHTAELERAEAARKRGEEAIRRLEEEKLSILNSMSERVVYQNPQHRVLWANKAAAEAADLAREQLVGCYCYEIWSKRSKPCSDCPVEKARETGKPQASEMTTPDGKAWLVQGYPIRDTDDRIVGLVEVALEITERKQVEEALRKGERKFELLFESTLDGMFVLDAETMKIVLANQAAVDIFGLNSVEGAIGVNLLDCVPPEERERVLRIIVKDMFENDLRQVNEVRGITRDGRKIWLSVVGTRTEYRGKLAGLISFSDITERKQAEEVLQTEKNKLQSVIDALEYGLTIQDRDYNILYQSGPLKKYFGEHLGEKCYQVYEGRDTISDDCPVKKAFKDGKSHSAVKKGTTPSGEVFIMERTACPIRDAEGEIVSCLEVTKDITESKKAEQALADEATRRSILIDQSRDGIVVLDENGKVYEANQRFAEMLGYTPEEVTQLNVWDWEYLFSREQLLEMIRTVDEAGDHFETKHRRKDGTIYDVEISTNGAVFAGQKLIFCVCRDITERKQAEDALRESEEFNASLLENSPNPVTVMNPDTSIRYVNPALEKLTGFKVDEVIGKKQPYPWWIEGKTQETLDRIREKPPKGGQSTKEVLFQKKNGEQLWVNLGVSMIERDGELSYTLVNWVDVTERKQAEQVLRQSEEKYRTIFENVSDVIIRVDRYGKIIDVNGKAEECFGYKPEEVIGKNFAKIGVLSLKDLPKMVKLFGGAIRGKHAPIMVELEAKRKDGSSVLVEVNPKLVEKNGKAEGVVAIVRDITERKQAEEELRLRAQILDSVNDTILVHDADDNFIYVNEAACRTHGYSREELLKMKIPQLVDPERARPLKLDRQELLEKGQIVVESAHVRKDGSKIPVEIHARTVGSGKSKLFLTVARDITERKLAEEKRQTILKTALDGFWLVNLEGKLLEVNDSYCKMVGYTREELLKMSIPDLEAIESPKEVAQRIAKIMAQGYGRFETRHRRKDGQMINVEMSVNYLDVGEGQMFVFARDITDRKRAGEAVRESEEKLRKMFESVTDGISVIDLNGIITSVNQRTVEMHGFGSKDEILGKSALELIAPRDHDRVAANMRKALKREIVKGVEYTLLKADGSEFPGELSTSVLKDAAGKAIGHITISRDITERKEAEELYETLANSSPIGVYILQGGKFQFVNPQFQEYTGFSQDELLGKESLGIVHPEDRERVRENAVRMLKGKRLSPYELRYIVKNGEILWATETVTSIQYRGKRAVLGNFIDITERKRSEEEKKEMEQKAHLASRLASVGEMASGIAHEINNPLTSVIGFSQLLMEGDIPPDIKEDVGIIYKEAQRAAGVAKNLLTFARKQAPAKQPTNINSIIEGVLKLRAYEQRVNNIQVDSQLAPDLPEVMADYSQLQQVFINIIINAESAMIEANKGGTLTITTQRVNKTVRASFSDDGPGITRENLNRIFDPFFTTKEVGKGTGLGLSVCHGIVAEHSGKMYARSKLGQGATFVVELPVNNS